MKNRYLKCYIRRMQWTSVRAPGASNPAQSHGMVGPTGSGIQDLSVDGGTAEQFVEASDLWSETSDEAAMLQACPDHYVIRTLGDGRQDVLERTGGSPLPSLFFIDYDDISSLVTPADPQFPHQIAGVARTSDGVAIGGVRHQFRNTHNGFHARLTVEFPLPTLGRMVAGHRWQLVCEFSNWIEAAFV